MLSSKISLCQKIIFFTLYLITTNTLSVANLTTAKIINKISLNKYTKTEIPLGDYMIYLNHTTEELKNSMLDKARNIKNDTDGLNKFLGLKTKSQTRLKFLNDYFAKPGFVSISSSPAFALADINTIALDVKRIESHPDFNVKSYYDSIKLDIAELKSSLSTTPLNSPSPQLIHPSSEDFSQYLNTLPSHSLTTLSIQHIINNFKALHPPIPTLLDASAPSKLRTKILKLNESLLSMTNIFQDWYWFLTSPTSPTPITLEEISANNTAINWVYLHELSHLSQAQTNLKKDYHFPSKAKTRLLREINSDLFAAIMLDYDNQSTIFKKIDSMMYTRILKYQDTIHFTLVPLMVMKIIMHHPNYTNISTFHQKEIVIQQIIQATIPHLDDIITTNSNMTKTNHHSSALKLKKYVFAILKDLASTTLITSH